MVQSSPSLRCKFLGVDALRRLSILGETKTSIKLPGLDLKQQPKDLLPGKLPSGYGFVLSIAPPSLFCDRRIKMKEELCHKVVDFVWLTVHCLNLAKALVYDDGHVLKYARASMLKYARSTSNEQLNVHNLIFQ